MVEMSSMQIAEQQRILQLSQLASLLLHSDLRDFPDLGGGAPTAVSWDGVLTLLYRIPAHPSSEFTLISGKPPSLSTHSRPSDRVLRPCATSRGQPSTHSRPNLGHVFASSTSSCATASRSDYHQLIDLGGHRRLVNHLAWSEAMVT